MRVQCELCHGGQVSCGDGDLVYGRAGVCFVWWLGAGRVFMAVFVL